MTESGHVFVGVSILSLFLRFSIRFLFRQCGIFVFVLFCDINLF